MDDTPVLGTVDAGDAELVGWGAAPGAGPVPLPRVPAPVEMIDPLEEHQRALTVLPQRRRGFFSRK